MRTAEWWRVRYQVLALGEGSIAYSSRIELDPTPSAAENFAERGIVTVERMAVRAASFRMVLCRSNFLRSILLWIVYLPFVESEACQRYPNSTKAREALSQI